MIIYYLSHAHYIVIPITRSSDLQSVNIVTTSTTTSKLFSFIPFWGVNSANAEVMWILRFVCHSVIASVFVCGQDNSRRRFRMSIKQGGHGQCWTITTVLVLSQIWMRILDHFYTVVNITKNCILRYTIICKKAPLHLSVTHSLLQ